jgi:hypothetical protein
MTMIPNANSWYLNQIRMGPPLARLPVLADSRMVTPGDGHPGDA